MPTLSRQYRPQRFDELYGQEHVAQTLVKAIEKERVAHAYLFYGPRGVGKTSTARILAKRLQCTKATSGEPCGTCKICKATQANQNIDIIEIDAASNRGIDDIRALKEGLGLKPAMSTYKVYIIDEVHMLTNEAFTALLKTLEEPVAHAVFILATTELHKVPETILSRCQVYRFRRATNDELKARLQYLLKQEKRQADDTVISFIISRSDGCYRDAESLLGQLLTLSENKVLLSDATQFLGLPPRELIDNFLQALIVSESAPALAASDKAFADGFDPEQFIRECIVEARDAAVALAVGNTTLPPYAALPQAGSRLPHIIRALLQALQDVAFVPQPLIAIHLAILTLCTRQGATSATPQTVSNVSVSVPKPQTTAPQMPAQKKAVVPVTPPETSPKTVQDTPSAAVPLEKIKALWPQLIQTIKKSNPVASTFVRAIEPEAVSGTTLILRAQYQLHRGFFEKPANRSVLESALKELTEQSLHVQWAAQAASASIGNRDDVERQREENLLAAVKEVFGPGK